MKKILVIDGNSIINRAFYGIRFLSTSDGTPTNAIYGMINIIKKHMDELKPDYAAVTFDLKAPTFRHKLYDHYKEGRHATPQELLVQFPIAKEILSLMGLKVLELAGYEADDLQGTVAKMAHAEENTESYILSGDRDLLQLIDEKITVLLATNKDTIVMKEEEFLQKYGVQVTSFVDMKALMGDSSDNIPGVAGIGEKTAQGLISEFGTLEAIYENIDSPKITKGVREKLLRDRDMAFLSRELAKIMTDVPIDVTLDDLRYNGPEEEGLYRKLKELELNSFIAKFGLQSVGKRIEESKNVNKNDDTVATKTEPSGQISFGDLFSATDEVLEFTDDSDIIDNRSAVVFDEEAFYLYSAKDGCTRVEFSQLFESDIPNLSEMICYDGKALWHKLDLLGYTPKRDVRFLDLMLYDYVLSAGKKISDLPTLIENHLGKTVDSQKECISLMPSLEIAMHKQIEKTGSLTILEELEIPLLPILAATEKSGFMIDKEGMLEFSEALLELSDRLTKAIHERAGTPFNINSPKQLGEVLFEKMGLPHKQKKNKSGYSTDAETLDSLRGYDPIIEDILEYRHVTKLRGTYAAALPLVADQRSRIHTDFKQALTATGRLSSADPNLQNIPIRTKMGREMRRYFISRPGYVLVDADYSQIELRLLADISEDYNMSEAFKNGEDIHRKTASAVFGVPEEEVTEEMRKSAKAVNFGIVYGISGFSLAKDIGTTTSEATKYIKSYMYNYPAIDVYLDRVVREATENGFTVTPMGRRRYIPELSSPNGNLRAFGKRVAMNAPIQGAAADIMKKAMIKVDNALYDSGIDARIVMQVHDELVIEVKEEDKDLCMEITRREMENAVKLSVPLTVDVTYGRNWLEQS